jgi:hypothetical protein
MSRLSFAVLGLMFSAPALAADPPGAKPAPVTVSAPTAGSPEEAVLASLKMLKEGKAEQWMDTWCDPTRCSNKDQREDMLTYSLKRAMTDASLCLHGDKDDAILVKRIDGDPAKDTRIKVFIDCSSPISTPATLLKVDGKWKIESQSW